MQQSLNEITTSCPGGVVRRAGVGGRLGGEPPGRNALVNNVTIDGARTRGE